MSFDDERADRMRRKLNSGLVTVGWHSIRCTCDDCLDSDAAAYLFTDQYRFDFGGLYR